MITIGSTHTELKVIDLCQTKLAPDIVPSFGLLAECPPPLLLYMDRNARAPPLVSVGHYTVSLIKFKTYSQIAVHTEMWLFLSMLIEQIDSSDQASNLCSGGTHFESWISRSTILRRFS